MSVVWWRMIKGDEQAGDYEKGTAANAAVAKAIAMLHNEQGDVRRGTHEKVNCGLLCGGNACTGGRL